MSVEHLLHAMVEKLKLEPVLEMGRLLGIGSLLQDLQKYFSMIHGKISGIDESAVLMINVNNEQYLQLLQRLWSLTLDTDDALNRISRHLRKKGGIFSFHQVRRSPIFRRLHFRRVNKIREAVASLENCYAQIYRIRLPAKHTDIQEAMSCQRTCGEPEGVLGRERELDDVLRMMQTDDSTPGLSILPITGMAGIGKTTLAQLVFWHPWVVDTFGDDRIWVSVPRDFNTMVILSRIAQVLTTQQCSTSDSPEEEMIEQEDSVKLKCLVKEKLNGRRFFLVLDDAWDQDREKWQKLMQVLDSAGKPGSKMIVTSRIPDVVTLTKSLKPYTLQRLLPAHSSSLLTQWMQNPAELPPRLIPIRKMIAETCAGVPSLLLSASNKLKSIRKTQVAWQHVLSRFDLVFYADRLLLDAAYVSYQHLPPSIQQCFLYCSLLLVHSFTPEQLTDMFVADELIKLISSKSDMHLYFSQMMTEHFYDVVQKSRHGGNIVYKMHPGMQLLAQRISRGFHLAIDARKEIIWPSCDARCLSLLVDCETSKLPPELFELESLRTLILLRDENMLLSENKCAITDIPAEFCQRLIALRVLHMQSCRIKRIPRLIDMLQNLTYINLSHNDIEIVPDSVSNLRFLTHLNLSQNEITELPESVGKMQSLQMLDLSHCEKLLGLHEAISNLVNLYTLNLEGCHYLAVLPKGMKNLRSLTYLNILECPLLTQMPRQMNQLTSIKILPRYIAAETPKHTISELRPLVYLKELGVQNMENSSSADARNVILQDKHELESLALSWTGDCTDPETSSRAQEILEHMKPRRGLKVLHLFSYPGRKLPSWINSGVPYLNSLTDIKLVNLACESLPPLGQLPNLKIAEVSGIDAVTCVDDTFYGADGTFFSLEKLSFFHMPNLKTWVPSHREGLFPCLQELTIAQCPKLTAVHVKLGAVTSLIMLMNNENLIACRGSLQGLSRNLRSLSISLCEELLENSQCEGLHELHVLEELQISRCTELISLPGGMRHLSLLRSLTITKCTKLETLPEWLKNITSLRSLCISDCPKLHIPESLNNLSHLQIILE
ncbi:unnamed protein product [Triticum turgidum subsp. durum]|uniref:NB-ARC domain-containing protein n=3 Tax=Triticum TaxID=4564 RepID=A0A9R0QWS3_TRITD|nr:unnamed protein product [Triticum turgidum subsp. durum]